MNLTGLSKEGLSQLKKEIEEEIKNRNKNYVLKLKINRDDNLTIYYIKGHFVKRIGCLNKNTNRIDILNSISQYENYEEWREQGMKIDESVIEWLGGKYQLEISISNNIILKRIDIKSGIVYDFEECNTVSYCEDTNLLRFKHNHRPF